MSNFSQNAAAASSAPSSVQGAPSDGGYAKKVVKGSFWMVVTTVITRIGSFIAQIFCDVAEQERL